MLWRSTSLGDLSSVLSQPEISPADRAPTSVPHSANVEPKRDRRLTLTKIDRRGRLGKRIAELTEMFAAAGGELTPMRKLKVDKAAQLTAISELARGDFMRDGVGTLDDIVRLERKADQAVRALGIAERDPRPKSTSPLAAHFAGPPKAVGA
jgi:hypothetical protein